VRWTHRWEGGSRAGRHPPAANPVFPGAAGNELVALNAPTGDPLWHAGLNASISNGPITYTLDGIQYVVVAAADTVWSFVMNTR
jgi:alcohol dehydrogenase (cytochrome c)